MIKYLKATIAFAASSLLVCTASLPEKDIISFVDNSTPSAYEKTIETLELSDIRDFYDLSNKTRNITAPIVKLNAEISFPWENRIVSSATGFSVAYDKKEDKSYVITNHHFCDSLDEFRFPGRIFYEDHTTLMSSKIQHNDGYLTLITSDPSKDLCLLAAEGYIKPAKIASKNYKIKQMEEVTTIGAPAGIFPIMLDARISGLFERDILPEHMQQGDPLLLLSTQIFGGQSGSPIYNKRGQVIGVLFISLSNDSETIYGGIAIPLGDLREFLDSNLIDY